MTLSAAPAAPDLLAAVMPLSDYRSSTTSRCRLFPSDGAVEWYVRNHKDQLVNCGAMLKVRGSWHVHAERFDQAVLDIAQASSKLAAA